MGLLQQILHNFVMIISILLLLIYLIALAWGLRKSKGEKMVDETNFYKGAKVDFTEGSITISGLFLIKGKEVKVLMEGVDYIIDKDGQVEFIEPLNMQEGDSIRTEFTLKSKEE